MDTIVTVWDDVAVVERVCLETGDTVEIVTTAHKGCSEYTAAMLSP